MADEKKARKDNTGALFRADKKGNDKRPDYTGRVKIAGVEYRLSGWVKSHDGVAGGNYISLAFTPIEGSNEQQPF